MGLCSSAHDRAPLRKHPNVEYDEMIKIANGEDFFKISIPRYIEISNRHLPPKDNKLTTINQNKIEHISPNKEGKSLSTRFIAPLSPDDVRQLKSSSKDVSEDLQLEDNTESYVSITADDTSTSLPESVDQISYSGKIEYLPDTVKQQTWNFESDDTNQPSEILVQLRRLLDTDRPEIKALATELLECISKQPASERDDNNSWHEAKSMSRSLNNLHTRFKSNDVNIKSEMMSDWDECNESNTSLVSVEGGKPLPNFDPSMSSENYAGENKPMPSETEDHIGEKGDNMPTDDEETKVLDLEILEFSKQQVLKTRRKRLVMTRALENMPSLAQTLANTKKSITKGCSLNDGNEKEQEFIDLEKMTSEIDKLDNKINKSTLMINSLRRKSLDILTKGDDPGNNNEVDGRLSFVSVEKEINRWQEHKNKLVDNREILISNLQSNIITDNWDSSYGLFH